MIHGGLGIGNPSIALELITAHIATAISHGVQVEVEQNDDQHVKETEDDQYDSDEDDEEDDQYDSDEDDEDPDQYDSDEDDEDLVIGEIGESEADSDGNGSNMSEDEDVAATIFCTTRSGRRATTWRKKDFEY